MGRNILIIHAYTENRGDEATVKAMIAAIKEKEPKKADIVLHAPDGPSIGDIYEEFELLYLKRLHLIKKMGVSYMFYAPSMDPFKSEKRNKQSKIILQDAEKMYE